jgi:predicted N-acyltransferase
MVLGRSGELNNLMADLTTSTVSSLSEIDRNQWDNITRQSDFGTIYHTASWLEAIEATFGQRPIHVLVQKDGNLVALLPQFVTQVADTRLNILSSISRGFGGPIVSGNQERALKLLVSRSLEFVSGTIVSHKIRTDQSHYLRFHPMLNDLGYDYRLNGKFVIDLTQGWTEIQQNMHKDRRYEIRKACESDFDVSELDLSRDNLDEFYTHYESTISELNGNLLPFEFFSNLNAYLSDEILLTQVEVEGECRGYHFYILDRQQSTIRHFISAVQEDDYRYYPTQLLHKHCIQWGIENGYKTYDMGGACLDFRDGTFQYKRKYGGTLTPIYRWEHYRSRWRRRVFKSGKRIYDYIRS